MSKVSSIYRLGDVAASELLLTDLYINLRRSLFSWASVTLQTPQARMGYVGQHLTSVVTGIPGGRSGARGNDLYDPKTKEFHEIKTCTRVDQLGQCGNCSESVAAIERECPACSSDVIIRKDDSKWLITPQTDYDMKHLFDPTKYFLVLFDFEDLDTAEDINARIYSVDPQTPGFNLCMVDYWVNIRSKSKSKAPFNLWPFSFKFELMKPELIYHAIIHEDDSISTLIFPGRDAPVKVGLSSLLSHARATTLTREIVQDLCTLAGIEHSESVSHMTRKLDHWREVQKIPDDKLIDLLSKLVYWEQVKSSSKYIPANTLNLMRKIKS